MKAVLNKKNFLVLIAIFSMLFLYFCARATYTAYESIVSGKARTNVSGIRLTINGEELGTDALLDNRIILDNITWTNTHTREGKMSPGSTGTFTFELDPTGSEVAILYEIQFVDKVMDDDKILTFNNITSDQNLVRTGVDTYSGIISLSDAEDSVKTHITVNFSFDGSDDIEGFDQDNQVYEDFFEINFHALQYKGETLVPYMG